MPYKCKHCGYIFKKTDSDLCPECFTSRDDVDCTDFEKYHSHGKETYSGSYDLPGQKPRFGADEKPQYRSDAMNTLFGVFSGDTNHTQGGQNQFGENQFRNGNRSTEADENQKKAMKIFLVIFILFFILPMLSALVGVFAGMFKLLFP